MRERKGWQIKEEEEEEKNARRESEREQIIIYRIHRCGVLIPNRTTVVVLFGEIYGKSYKFG